MRLLYAEDVDADQIAATIKERGGIQKLANEAAKPRRKGAKKRAEKDDAESEEENGKAIDDAVADVEEAADATKPRALPIYSAPPPSGGGRRRTEDRLATASA